MVQSGCIHWFKGSVFRVGGIILIINFEPITWNPKPYGKMANIAHFKPVATAF